MDSQKTSVIRCPQCSSYCNKTETAITHEHSIECRVCGYQEIQTTIKREEFKGYGSLVINDTAVVFHSPILFEQEQEILSSIIGNPNARFIKWTDKHGLTVLKGELPEDFSDEEREYFERLAEDEERKEYFDYSPLPHSGQL